MSSITLGASSGVTFVGGCDIVTCYAGSSATRRWDECSQPRRSRNLLCRGAEKQSPRKRYRCGAFLLSERISERRPAHAFGALNRQRQKMSSTSCATSLRKFTAVQI